MRIYLIVFIVCLLPSIVQAEKPLELNAPQRLGYALGMDIGNSIKNMGPPIDIDYLLKGIKAIYLGQEPLLTPNAAFIERQKYATNSHGASDNSDKNISKKQSLQKRKNLLKWRRKKAAINASKEKEFLKSNEKALGVATTKTGLQYMVIRKGTGKKPTLKDYVLVHYSAATLQGKEFDSSYKRGKPVLFPLNKALAGWQEALQMMRVGAKYRIYVPAKLTYGENGSGTLVEPGATLIFKIELVGIENESSYLEKTKEIVPQIPPYTDPSRPKTIKRSALMKRVPFITKDDVSLKTSKDAARAFMQVLHFIMPVSSDLDVVDGCGVVATKSYEDACLTRLKERITWLKSLEGLRGADFVEAKVEPSGNDTDIFLDSWKEIFSFKDDSTKVFERQLSVKVVKDDGDWRVDNVIEPD